FTELGLDLKEVWNGNTVIAWGGGESVKDLSRELENAFKEAGKKDPKFNEKVKVKTAVAEGELVTFEQALKRPTRLGAGGGGVGGDAPPPGPRLGRDPEGPRGADRKQDGEKDEGSPAGGLNHYWERGVRCRAGRVFEARR